MVSSAVKPRVRRTMGDELSLGEAVLLAQMLDIAAGADFEAHAGAAIVFKATRSVGPGFGGAEELEGDGARVPADAAVGFAPESKVEPGFGVREEDRKLVEDAFADRLAAHGCEAVADHEDHQRPEADHDAQKGGDITQQPDGQAPTFHGREFKPARSPAGLRRGFPQVFWRKPLRLLRKNFLYPPNLRARLPTKCGASPRVALVACPHRQDVGEVGAEWEIGYGGCGEHARERGVADRCVVFWGDGCRGLRHPGDGRCGACAGA